MLPSLSSGLHMHLDHMVNILMIVLLYSSDNCCMYVLMSVCIVL